MKNLRRIYAILLKELRQLKRDRMTFGMVIMIPLIQLLLFGFAINTNIRNIPVGLVDHSQTTLSRILIQTISATQVVDFTHHYNNTQEAEAEAGMVNADVRAVLVIPNDLPQRLVRNQAVGLSSPPSTDEETSRAIAGWIVDGSDTMIAAAIKGQ